MNYRLPTIVSVLLFATVGLADTHYVCPNSGSAGTPPYTSWATATDRPQYAINAAEDGDTVVISNGVVGLYGQYIPDVATMLARFWCTSDITIVSLNGPDGTRIESAQNTYGARGVHMVRGRLVGFTITNGFTKTAGDVYTERSGGGVWLGAEATMMSCRVVNCWAAHGGGGVYLEPNARMSDSMVANCIANYGGGVLNRGGLISTTLMWYNSATNDGGGLYNDGNGWVSGCVISGNYAQVFGGGAFCRAASSLYASHILANYASDNNGGGVYLNNLNGATTLEGCTIAGNGTSGGSGGGVAVESGCRVTASTIAHNYAVNHAGGGVLCLSNGVVEHCTIVTNMANGGGGGVKMSQGGWLDTCTVASNSTGLSGDSGGGIYCDHGGTVTNCSVFANETKSHGGGIYCASGGEVVDSMITGNQCAGVGFGNGGGVCLMGEGALAVRCDISGNSARGEGGGLYATGPMVLSELTVRNNAGSSGGGVYLGGGAVLTNALLSGNRATDMGGGACVDDGRIWTSTISGNAASNVTGKGGGVALGANGSIFKCTITSNHANMGGGVLLGGGIICDSLIAANRALMHGADSGQGGGIYSIMPSPSYIMSCTIATNHAAWRYGGLCGSEFVHVDNTIIRGNTSVQVDDKEYSTAGSFTNCCSMPLPTVGASTGCTDADPLYADAAAGNFRLTDSSPCRDAGTNQSWMTDETDLDGNPRIVDGVVDMGCYEVVPEPAATLFVIVYSLFVMRRRSVQSDGSDGSF